MRLRGTILPNGLPSGSFQGRPWGWAREGRRDSYTYARHPGGLRKHHLYLEGVLVSPEHPEPWPVFAASHGCVLHAGAAAEPLSLLQENLPQLPQPTARLGVLDRLPLEARGPGGAEPVRQELVVERVQGGAGAALLSPPLPSPRSLVPGLSLVFLCWTSVRDLCQEHLGLFMTSVCVYLGYNRRVSHVPPAAQASGLQFARVSLGFHPLAACRSSVLAVGRCGCPVLTWRPPE